jgi:hypothetical protein
MIRVDEVYNKLHYNNSFISSAISFNSSPFSLASLENDSLHKGQAETMIISQR